VSADYVVVCTKQLLPPPPPFDLAVMPGCRVETLRQSNPREKNGQFPLLYSDHDTIFVF